LIFLSLSLLVCRLLTFIGFFFFPSFQVPSKINLYVTFLSLFLTVPLYPPISLLPGFLHDFLPVPPPSNDSVLSPPLLAGLPPHREAACLFPSRPPPPHSLSAIFPAQFLFLQGIILHSARSVISSEMSFPKDRFDRGFPSQAIP